MDPLGESESQKLLRAANLHRLRGEAPEALAKCRRAILADPQDLFAREMLGDLLLSQGDAGGAEQVFRDMLVLNPGHRGAETKLAQLVARRTRVAAAPAPVYPYAAPAPPATIAANPPRVPFQNAPQPYPDAWAPPRHVVDRKSPFKAMMLSAFIPGLGQLYNEQGLKGIVLIVLMFVLSVAAVKPFMPALQSYVTTLTGALNNAGSGDFDIPTQVGLPAITPANLAIGGIIMALVLGVYLYAGVDAFVTATRLNQRREAEANRAFYHAPPSGTQGPREY
ncbi:MAG TPA: DUF5683 domain-containing protein [Armatimonadota bacterium]|jgi:TM2 domain-containing membrane protein YozV